MKIYVAIYTLFLNYTLNLLDTTVALVELHKLTFNILKGNNKMF